MFRLWCQNKSFYLMPIIPKAKRPGWIPEKDKSRWTKSDGGAFYDSTQWRKIRRLVIADEPICIYCKADGIIQESQVVDHVIPIELGGSQTDRNNLQGICTSHHNSKSSHEGKCNNLLSLHAYYLRHKEGVGVKNFWRF